MSSSTATHLREYRPVAKSSLPFKKVFLLALPGMMLAIACLFPFLNKAFTIDDPLFLLEARQILRTPLEPWSFPACWMGNETCLNQAGGLGANAREGLMGYFLVPVVLAQGAEWLAHLLQIIFSSVVVLSMVGLALRLKFDRIQASVAGLLAVSIPPFLSMASTAMPDILALALALTGLERIAAWKEEKRWAQAIIASAALGLAPYARPHVVLFLPLAALWLFDDFGPRKAIAQFRAEWKLWVPILGAAATLLAANLLTQQHNAGHEQNRLLDSGNIPLNTIAYLLYLSFPLPLAFGWLMANWKRAKFLVLLPAVPLIVANLLMSKAMTLELEVQLASVLYSCLVLYDLLSRFTWIDKTTSLLTLWLLIPLPAVIYVHLPLKYMLAAMPAVIFILLRVFPAKLQRGTLLACTVVLLGFSGYSWLLLRADADFAEYGRKAAAELIVPRVAAGEKVWFSGQWGFYWYAQEAGARVSKPNEPGPNPGELLVVGLMEGGDAALQRFPNRELVDRRSYDSPHGRTMGYGAGLYSNRFGLLPWRWKPSAVNDYEVWRIH